jgi:hypothetical protein
VASSRATLQRLPRIKSLNAQKTGFSAAEKYFNQFHFGAVVALIGHFKLKSSKNVRLGVRRHF